MVGLFIYVATNPVVLRVSSPLFDMQKGGGGLIAPAPAPGWYTNPAWWGVIIAGLGLAWNIVKEFKGKK
jgi:hypothetical protein